MADILIHRDGETSRCYKLVNVTTQQVWDFTAEALAADLTADQSKGVADLTFNPTLHGFVIPIPETLPSGDYNLLLFSVARSGYDQTAEAEGFGFMWDQAHQRYYAPKERLADRVG